MKKSKSRTSEAKGTPKSQKTIEDSPARFPGKYVAGKYLSSKLGSKNSPVKPFHNNLHSPKGAIKHYMSNVELRSPNLKTLKPSESQVYLKNFAKEIQKPKIVKKKNQNLSELQTKLRTLENQITNLKTNIGSTDEHLQKIRKSRIKSKQSSKKSSVSASNKKRASESINPQSLKKVPSESKIAYKSMVRSPSKGLNSYVTKWKPSQSASQNKLLTEQTQSRKSKFSSVYYVKHTSALMKQHLLQSIKIFNYMQKISKPKQSEIQDIKTKLPNLKNPKQKTVVFDLDQTLIHCVEMNQPSDIKLPIEFPNGDVVQAGINIRKYAREILINLSKKFQVIVFTASHSCYANVILDHIDPERQLIHHRFFRDSCYKTEQGMFIKDLRIFCNRNLDNVVLVDNAPYSYFFQLSNGIPILPFYNSKIDTQLKTLEKFLLNQIYPANNVQSVLSKHFKLSRYPQYSTAQKIMKQLYKD